MAGSWQALHDTCNKIVGHWYCDQIKQHFIFDFNDKELKMSPLKVINTQGTFTTVYGVAFDISRGIELTDKFYFDVGHFQKRYYQILNLTKDMLVISEFWMMPNTEPASPLIYKRMTDFSVADDILKDIDLEPPLP